MWPAGVNAIGRVNASNVNTGREAFYDVLDGGATAPVNVEIPKSEGTAHELVSGFAQAAVLAVALGVGAISGGAEAQVNAEALGEGKPVSGATALVNVVATGEGESTGSSAGGSTTAVYIDPSGAGEQFATPSGGQVADIAAEALGDGSPVSGSEAGVAVTSEGKGTTTGGIVIVNAEALGAGEAHVFDSGGAQTLVRAFVSGGGNASEVFAGGRTAGVEIKAAGAGNQVAQLDPDHSGVNAHRVNASWVNTGWSFGNVRPTGGAESAVEVQAEGAGFALVTDATDGRTAFVDVVAEGAGAELEQLSGGATVSIEVGATGGFLLPQDGATVGIQVSATGEGFLAAEVPGRIIPVEPKIRTLFVDPKDRIILLEPREPIVVEPKDRIIHFPGDDEGLSMETKVKQPIEIVDYDIRLEEWFADLGSDFVVNEAAVDIDIVGEDNALVLGSSQTPEVQIINNGQTVKVWISGGTDGVTYMVTATINTNIGRREKVDFLIVVEEQAHE